MHNFFGSILHLLCVVPFCRSRNPFGFVVTLDLVFYSVSDLIVTVF